MRRILANHFFLPLSLLAIFGCDGGSDDPDAGPQVDACTNCRPDSGRPDGGPTRTGDGDDSFADARPLTVGGTPQMSTIRAANDRDYYSFTATAGQWVRIVAEAASDASPVDTVVTLYDGSMQIIAENDDFLPRVGITDSELITRLPSEGTYYVLVQEYSSWDEDDDVASTGGSDYAYEVFVDNFVASATAQQNNVEVEAGNDAASAITLTAGNAQSIIGGRFDAANDVDVYAFSVAAGGNFRYQVTLLPGGAGGNGSDSDPERIWITDMSGTTVIGRLDPSAFEDGDEVSLTPPVAAGNYLLWVRGPSTVEANSFYVLRALRGEDNTPETDDVMNNLPATAQTLTLTAASGNPRRSAFILSRLGVGDTADYFRFEAMAGETVGIFCRSRTNGSGVVDLNVALMNDLGTEEIVAETETANEPISIERANVTAGNYLVRVTKASQDPEVTGDWVRCGVSSGPAN